MVRYLLVMGQTASVTFRHSSYQAGARGPGALAALARSGGVPPTVEGPRRFQPTRQAMWPPSAETKIHRRPRRKTVRIDVDVGQ